MPSLKDLKVRIKSVKSTQKITKAMKVVAAAKLNRARQAAESARPYATAMESMVTRLAAGTRGQSGLPVLLAGTGKDTVELLVVVTADRGLSGAFNSSVVRAAKKRIRELQAAGKTVKIYTVGRKGRDWLSGEFKSLILGSRIDVAKGTGYRMADDIAQEIFAAMRTQGLDRVTMVYNQFKSVISQVVTFQQLMPLSVPEVENPGAAASYEYEPSEEEILADLLPRNFTMQIFSALLENNAGFYGAQMNAMENATKNAGEMIKKLTLKYNRTRQANITKELIEIISGAEAI
ncbi:MAG: F0F1 ATP synthase subunit gamma [Alphaproteobacteria bacterium]|nr:F0F1 ATP synthase subunit gamma [Alphaproteobacteria bacterium]